MDRYTPKLCTEQDSVRAIKLATGVNWELRDFWRWRYANLMDDATKGDFAEWLVGKLLGLQLEPGGYISGANFDLIAHNGLGSPVTIEVKSSAYWQSWKFYDSEKGRWRSKDEIRGLEITPDRRIIFGGLYRRTIHGSKLSAESGFKSELYIFAFQNEKDPFKWDALDLHQWEFFVLTRQVLEQEKAKRDAAYRKPPKGFSLSLSQLRDLSGGRGISATELQARTAELL